MVKWEKNGEALNMRYGFVGLGNMASAIIRGMHGCTEFRTAELFGIDHHPEKAEGLPLHLCASLEELTDRAELLLLCVKPHALEALLAELRPLLRPDCVVASVAAGKPIAWYEERLPALPFVRVMPNINARVNAGTSAVCGGSLAKPEHVAMVKAVFDAVGSAYELEERHFSAFSAIAGAAPAYTYLYIDALASAGVKAGLTKASSLSIAADMVLGSAKLVIESGEHPAVLSDRVCSPGGTTIEGLHRLRALGFENAVYEAIDAVIQKDRSLGS